MAGNGLAMVGTKCWSTGNTPSGLMLSEGFDPKMLGGVAVRAMTDERSRRPSTTARGYQKQAPCRPVFRMECCSLRYSLTVEITSQVDSGLSLSHRNCEWNQYDDRDGRWPRIWEQADHKVNVSDVMRMA